MNDAINAIDHAADKSDRWLFIAAIVLLVFFAVLVWRWMANDREKIADRLTAITDRHIQSQEKLVEVVTNNTHALREVKDVMGFCKMKSGSRSES